jgi:hypothetical protein
VHLVNTFNLSFVAVTRKLYQLWITLLVISGGIALWFSGVAASAFWQFFKLNESAPAIVLRWEIKDLSSSCFAPQAEFEYEVEGVGYSGKTIFRSPQFPNRFAAENHIKTLQAQRWRVWYQESTPSVSSLEKEFPRREFLQALLTVGVFAYFYFARSLLPRFIS